MFKKKENRPESPFSNMTSIARNMDNAAQKVGTVRDKSPETVREPTPRQETPEFEHKETPRNDSPTKPSEKLETARTEADEKSATARYVNEYLKKKIHT